MNCEDVLFLSGAKCARETSSSFRIQAVSILKQFAFEFARPEIENVVLKGILPCSFDVFPVVEFGPNGIAKRLRGTFDLGPGEFKRYLLYIIWYVKARRKP